jgi:hypothetical protein
MPNGPSLKVGASEGSKVGSSRYNHVNVPATSPAQTARAPSDGRYNATSTAGMSPASAENDSAPMSASALLPAAARE